MFDFGFSELVLIAIVTLVVVGPERLPKVARTAGHLLGRLQRYVSDVKSDIQREMQLEELKKLQQQVEQQARQLETSIQSEVKGVQSELGSTAAAAEATLKGEPAPVAEATPVPAPPTPAAPVAAADASVEKRAQLELGLDGTEQPLRPQAGEKA